MSVISRPFEEILSEKYLSYALSTIMSRSLPDVRDGLKPVHRRLLYAMDQLRLNPSAAPKKCARVVGDVIGKYHPHGDQSVYDALVRLAQDFAVRYPLIDGQGNFGNIDGDNPAAMRYTEARLTSTALLLLGGIEEDAVAFRPTYDGTEEEPVVLPAGFPNLLANGSSGIAVGMATNIPPHNVAEICAALQLMLTQDDPSITQICTHITGPDFPTGGLLCESRETIIAAYETGRGSFRVRARWVREDLGQGRYQIVVTEIPWQVQKAKLIQRIADLLTDKKLPLLDDVRDESAEDVRLVLVPRSRTVVAEVLMESLFRACDLEVRFGLNMNALDGGVVPRVMSLKEMLRAYLDHTQEVLVRRSHHRLAKVKNRLEVLGGYLLVYLNIEDVIAIIRHEDAPKPALIDAFGLSDIQAEAVLNMRLRSLRKLEEIEIRAEHDALVKESGVLGCLLGSESEQWRVISAQINALAAQYGTKTALGARRTTISVPPCAVVAEDLDEALIEREPITVLLSEKGWIRALKGHGHDAGSFKYKESDSGQCVLEVCTTDRLLAVADTGRIYTLAADKLPTGRGLGEPVRLMIDLPNDAGIVALVPYQAGGRMLVMAQSGHGFIVPMDEVLAATRGGRQVMMGTLVLCLILEDSHDHLALIGTNRKMVVFPLAQIPQMARGKGVILQKYKEGTVCDAKTFQMTQGLGFKYGSGTRIIEDLTPWLGKRAAVGRLPPNGFPRNGKF